MSLNVNMISFYVKMTVISMNISVFMSATYLCFYFLSDKFNQFTFYTFESKT